MEMKTLDEARVEIDAIDKNMADLFEQRMRVVEDVVRYKMAHDLPVFDPLREQQVIQKNSKYIGKEEYRSYYVDFLQHFMDVSKDYQKTFVELAVVGYQGTLGAFGHLATKHCFPDNEKIAYATFESVFQAVMNDEIAYGVIPFENSYTGEVGEVLDLLKVYPLYINDIYDLKVNQNLLGLPGSKISDVTQVYSHHQAISQCQLFLKGRDWEVVPYPNTALAAEYIKQQGDKRKAAIASKETAEIYGLDVLAEDINTAVHNTTRFIVLSKQKRTKGNRFNLLFTVKHDAGQLAKVMQLFAAKGFSLENIKSRSMRDEPWKYYFYVEVVGNLEDAATKQLLNDIANQCEDLKVLGSFTIKE